MFDRIRSPFRESYSNVMHGRSSDSLRFPRPSHSSERIANKQWHKYFGNLAMELTAAGLLRIFTGFPFNHYTERLREPMQGKGTN